jgi:DNA-binding transcriptional LysR family regulator
MDRLRDMEMFVRVVERGSFSAAAHDLKIGQPTISKMMAGLEERLGVRLLVRSTRGLRPTEAGTAFYERAVRAIAGANEAEAAAQGAGAGLEGRLRICTPVTFGRLHVVPKLGAFLDAYPKIQLELVMDDRKKDFVAENIDVSLRLGVLADSALVARKLAQAEQVVVASPAYLVRKGVPQAPADLREHDGIIYRQSSGGEDWVFRRGSSETKVRIPRRLTFTAAEGVRSAVMAGLGFTVADRWMFAPELESGEVVPLIEEWRLPSIDLWAIYPSGQLTSTKARAFVKWFEKIITQRGHEQKPADLGGVDGAVRTTPSTFAPPHMERAGSV